MDYVWDLLNDLKSGLLPDESSSSLTEKIQEDDNGKWNKANLRDLKAATGL